MKERPIIFSSPMVRAILDGRKTQTRRDIKEKLMCGEDAHVNNCQYGKPGDRLWVRETFCYHDDLARYLYKADGVTGVKWKPSIFMPRIASRIMLEITGIRVERLQDISEEDAIAEGVDGENEAAKIGAEWYEKPKRAYRRLWKSINGTGSWDLNPFVWVIEFMVLNNERDTDQYLIKGIQS